MGRAPHPLDEPSWFWAKVDIREDDECWPWLGGTVEHGHGRVWAQGTHWWAHRLAYVLTFGEPDGIVCHRCNNPICCNPRHLYDGTPLSNTEDRRAAGISTSRQGAANHEAKLTSEDVAVIRYGGERNVVLAKRFGVSLQVISLVKNRHSYRNEP